MAEFDVEQYLKQFVKEENLAGVIKGFVGDTAQDIRREHRQREIDVLGRYVDELGIAHMISGYKQQFEEVDLPRDPTFADSNWRQSRNYESNTDENAIDWEEAFLDDDIYGKESNRFVLNQNKDRIRLNDEPILENTLPFLINRDPQIWLPYLREKSQLEDTNYVLKMINEINDDNVDMYGELLNNIDVDFNEKELKTMFETEEIVDYIIDNEPVLGGAVNTFDNYIRTSNPDNLYWRFVKREDIMRRIAPNVNTDVFKNWVDESPEIFTGDFIETTPWIYENEDILKTIVDTVAEEKGGDFIDFFSPDFVSENKETFTDIFGEHLVAGVVEEYEDESESE